MASVGSRGCGARLPTFSVTVHRSAVCRFRAGKPLNPDGNFGRVAMSGAGPWPWAQVELPQGISLASDSPQGHSGPVGCLNAACVGGPVASVDSVGRPPAGRAIRRSTSEFFGVIRPLAEP